ncbi:hypothetical protein VTN00DRAFT_3253 [Thermoascus crustaceus]|uniref:uncharacterized protein n=1 Tax=Thermoascus crustaceus TaxID=5088 RepID=UPI003744793B
MTPSPTRQTLSALFTSLSGPSSNPRRWTLTRTLRSDNPADINGELKGTATFTPLARQNSATTTDGAGTGTGTGESREMVYKEEGEMPAVPGSGIPPGLRWSKKYIWRLSDSRTGTSGDGDNGKGSGGISIWFVKVSNARAKNSSQAQGQDQEEADYLFHEFEFESNSTSEETTTPSDTTFVSPPTPPLPSLPSPTTPRTTTILTARGNHLCINDMYRTAYAFRIRPETGEVVSWASRHVVKGPRKDQDIVNLYE